jgi:single-strand DNA-binding protein
MNFNEVFFAGHLTREPELSYTQSGTALCKGSIAANYKSKEYQEVCFLDFESWSGTAELIANNFKKGNVLFVKGRLKLNQWESDGQKKQKHVIVVDRVIFTGGGNKNEQVENQPESEISNPWKDEEPKNQDSYSSAFGESETPKNNGKIPF